MELERFGELEQKVRGLVEEYSTLKNRNEELERLLEEKTARLAEAESAARVLNEQKDAVRAKVDMLLEMISDIDVP